MWLFVLDRIGEVLLTEVGQGSPERPFQPSDSDVDRSDPEPVLPSNGVSPSVECELESIACELEIQTLRESHTCRKHSVSGSVCESIRAGSVCPNVAVPSGFGRIETCSEMQRCLQGRGLIE